MWSRSGVGGDDEARSSWAAQLLTESPASVTASPTEAQLRAAGLEPGSVVVSIVTHDDAQRDDGTLMPLFFSPADFEAGWVRLKGDDLEMPDGDALMVMELRSLCAQMLGPQGGQLKVAQFVASPDAYAASSEATPWPAPREEEGEPPED